ncbi:HAAS signaling domain-containing protein [Micromonospora aurantiaca (nom. illeg.)]|uniref:HAAS signaling domain-containing protein n=1 Tax=Micromonospora aurantiaca (nom. illeg.) TaxID=47850 RepID=UPI0033CF5420
MTVTGQEITDYVDRVRAALADLPPEMRDELTEDLPEHLAEVAAEGDGALVDRLGTPEAYAAELRAAAGAQPRRRPARFHRLAEARAQAATQLRLLDRQLGPVLGHETVSDFLRPLRPAWWLMRGWLAALLVAWMVDGRSGLVPRLDGNSSSGLLLLMGAIVVSMWWGRRSAGITGWRRQLHQIATAALLLFSFAVLAQVDERADTDVYSGYEQTSVDHRYDRIEDVFVYDQQGRLIRDAQLFDQNGVPIRLGWPNCLDSSGAVPAPRNAYPYCPELAPFGAPASPSIAPPPAPADSAAPTAPAPTAPTTSASPEPTSTR